MTCREHIDQFLCDYVNGDLPTEQRAAFEHHIACCQPCQIYLDSYRKTIAAGRACCCHLRNPELAVVPDELVKAIMATMQRTGPSSCGGEKP